MCSYRVRGYRNLLLCVCPLILFGRYLLFRVSYSAPDTGHWHGSFNQSAPSNKSPDCLKSVFKLGLYLLFSIFDSSQLFLHYARPLRIDRRLDLVNCKICSIKTELNFHKNQVYFDKLIKNKILIFP